MRHLFMSTGILLAVDEKGQPVTVNAARASGLAASRLPVLPGSVSFWSLLRERNLFCDAGRLVYFSRWRACAGKTAGDTRIFLAECLPDQIRALPPENAGEIRWVTPDHALELFGAGELPMSLPTFASLRALADFDSIAGVLGEYGRMPASRDADSR
jgi:hypothetical protein